MGLSTDTVLQAAQAISRQVKDAIKPLTIHYIAYHEGQRQEALALAGQSISDHPAAETAIHLLGRAGDEEESGLIGMAVAHQNVFMGLANRDSVIALCAINVDRYDSVKEARRHIYHMAWHAIDTWQYHNQNSDNLDEGEITTRRRNAIELAAGNLGADIFSSIISALEGDRDAYKRLSLQRGADVLQRYGVHTPEYFPFIIALESTITALDELKPNTISRRQYIPAALDMARDVTMTFDADALRQWLAFGQPAQDMAWRGFSPERILSAAINTSEDTNVRAIGYLVSEITGVKPSSVLNIHDTYSPFADDSFNARIHEKAIESIFEDVIARGLKDRTSEAFREIANRQNLGLIDGQVSGWCAGALQAAGRAFENSLKDENIQDQDAGLIARREFIEETGKTPWKSLKTLGLKIIGQQRDGQPMSLKEIVALYKDDDNTGAASAIRRSLETTLKDPSWQDRPALQASTPQPRSPAPSAAPRVAAAPQTPSSGMMGGGMMGGGAVRRTTAIKSSGKKDESGDGKGQQK